MKSYKVTINGNNIMTTWGENEEDARKEAKRQLSKPGRQQILVKWEAAGSVVELKND